MAKLKQNCTICDKPLEFQSEFTMGADTVLRQYKCGHSFVELKTPAPTPTDMRDSDFVSLSGKKAAYPYQRDGIEFIYKTDFNCLIADPMGLGKTIQILLAARNAKSTQKPCESCNGQRVRVYPETPIGDVEICRECNGSSPVENTTQPRFRSILALVKSATQYQWYEESKEWFDPGLWSVFMIKGTKGFIPPGFRLYILSMDTLSRFRKKENGLKILQDLGIDLVIVDECHSFKDPSSSRSQALVEFVSEISKSEVEQTIALKCPLCAETWDVKTTVKINLRSQQRDTGVHARGTCPKCGARAATAAAKTEKVQRQKGLVLLSGTPIKNRAEEYFVPLNLLRPDIFTSLQAFKRDWLEQDQNTGKWNRIKSWKMPQFRTLTADFILRREKNEVLSLPPFRRTFETIYIEDDTIKAQYNKALANLAFKADTYSNLTYFDIQESLMTLRRITGVAKIPFAVEYIDTFLDTTENEKIAIGVHHEAVRDGIYYALRQLRHGVLKLSGEDSAESKNRIQHAFCDQIENRVLVVNMLAGGVGLNLQACNNALVLERQWNAADEEQFEGRFNRPGQTLPVLCEYMLAADTIDTYFSALVEQKRQICGESLDGWDFTSDSNAIRELVEKTISKKL